MGTGDIENLRARLDEPNSNVDEIISDGSTLLFWAADKGHHDCVEFLLDKGANPNHQGGVWGDFPLRKACNGSTANHMKTITLLLDRGALIDMQRAPNTGETALMSCCHSECNVDALELLIERGANIELKTDGKTALLVAALWTNVEAMEILLRAGADRSVRDTDGKSFVDWFYSGDPTESATTRFKAIAST
jgi:ankyrin repeat protein